MRTLMTSNLQTIQVSTTSGIHTIKVALPAGTTPAHHFAKVINIIFSYSEALFPLPYEASCAKTCQAPPKAQNIILCKYIMFSAMFVRCEHTMSTDPVVSALFVHSLQMGFSHLLKSALGEFSHRTPHIIRSFYYGSLSEGI